MNPTTKWHAHVCACACACVCVCVCVCVWENDATNSSLQKLEIVGVKDIKCCLVCARWTLWSFGLVCVCVCVWVKDASDI